MLCANKWNNLVRWGRFTKLDCQSQMNVTSIYILVAIFLHNSDYLTHTISKGINFYRFFVTSRKTQSVTLVKIMPRENAENMLMFLGNYLTVGVNETKFSSVSNTAFWPPLFHFDPKFVRLAFLLLHTRGPMVLIYKTLVKTLELLPILNENQCGQAVQHPDRQGDREIYTDRKYNICMSSFSTTCGEKHYQFK